MSDLLGFSDEARKEKTMTVGNNPRTLQLLKSPSARKELAAFRVGYSRKWISEPNKTWSEGLTPYRFLMRSVAKALLAMARKDRSAGGVSSARVANVQVLFRPTTTADVETAFWNRHSTTEYLNQLANAKNLTLYAGADGFADVGAPVFEALASTLLGMSLRDNPILKRLNRQDRLHFDYELIDNLAEICGSTFLGSIVQEVSRLPAVNGSSATYEECERRLNAHFDDALRISGPPSGFVARSLALLAYSLRHARRGVRVFSAHFDSDLARLSKDPTFQEARALFPQLDKYRLVPCASDDDAAAFTTTEIPLYLLNRTVDGAIATPSLLGEAGLLDDHFAATSMDESAGQTSRYELLVAALQQTTVVFVGTSLTDPGVVAALAKTRLDGPARYAVLLPPDLRAVGLPIESADDALRRRELSVRRSLTVTLLAQRYLYLGVVPIFVDFPIHVPRFLDELASTVWDDKHEPYWDRHSDWWKRRQSLFGSDPSKHPASTAAQRSREQWRSEVNRIHESIRATAVDLAKHDGNFDRQERIHVEVWIRNFAKRRLFQWVTSGRRRDRTPRPSVRLLHYGDTPNDLVQQTFRDGVLCHRERDSERGYVLSTPLTIRDSRNRPLHIGVAQIVSNRVNGGLTALAGTSEACNGAVSMLNEAAQGLMSSGELPA